MTKFVRDRRIRSSALRAGHASPRAAGHRVHRGAAGARLRLSRLRPRRSDAEDHSRLSPSRRSANVTTRYQLARLLPADITREFLSRTHYAIVADPNQADAVLAGMVTNFAFYPTVNDPVSGRATGRASRGYPASDLTDRCHPKGALLALGRRIPRALRDLHRPTAYFDESGTAMQRVSRDVARSVVAAILEGF